MAKKPTKQQLHSWAVHLIRKKGEFLGTVQAPDQEAAEQAAVEHFRLTAGSASSWW